MRMNIETKTVLNFLPNQLDINAIIRTKGIISMLQDKMNSDDKIMALETWEVITYEDLCKALCILNGIADNLQWEIVSPKEN